jgi:hypothetical protein
MCPGSRLSETSLRTTLLPNRLLTRDSSSLVLALMTYSLRWRAVSVSPPAVRAAAGGPGGRRAGQPLQAAWLLATLLAVTMGSGT